MTNTISPFKAFIKNYWLYYRELENEFMCTRKFVSFHEDNFSTYSIEFLKLYEALCSEIDVIGKAMAASVNNQFNPNNSQNNIFKWWFEIQYLYKITPSYYKDENEAEISLNLNTEKLLDIIEIYPWNKFEIEKYRDKKGSVRFRCKSGCSVPKWWSYYNDVKHNRTSVNSEDNSKLNYSKANLGNVCYALTALFTLEKAFMQKLGTQNELEAFADYSICFDKTENATSDEIQKLFS